MPSFTLAYCFPSCRDRNLKLKRTAWGCMEGQKKGCTLIDSLTAPLALEEVEEAVVPDCNFHCITDFSSDTSTQLAILERIHLSSQLLKC